jgi:tetrahydromethanopterin S-methyltransferase subunit B
MKAYSVGNAATSIDAEVRWSREPVLVARGFWQGAFYGTLLSLPCWALIVLLLKSLW